MEMYTLDLKNYRWVYRLSLVISGVIIAACWILVSKGYFILPRFYRSPQIFFPLLAVFVVTPFYFSNQYKKRLKQLDSFAEFDEKLPLHENIYKSRVVWMAFMTLSSCFLYLLNGHTNFLYLALFEYLIQLSAFPNKRLMEKELKNDEIIFL